MSVTTHVPLPSYCRRASRSRQPLLRLLSPPAPTAAAAVLVAVLVAALLAVPAAKAHHFRIVTINEAPFCFIEENPDTGEEVHTGFVVQFVEQLFGRLFPGGNWTYDIYEVPDGNYGAIREGKWNGMIGEVESGKADMALAPLTITNARMDAVDFSSSFLDMGLIIMVRKVESTDFFGFMQPFTWDLWVTLIATNVVVGVLLFLFDRLTPYGFSRKSDTRKNFSFSNSLLNTTMALFGQDSDPGKSWATRFLMLGYFFVMMIALSSYTANLAAFLAVKRLDAGVASLNDIRLRGSLFCVMQDSAPADYFLTSSLVSDMRKYMVEKPTFEDCVKALRSMEVEAAITDSPVIEYIINQEPCDTLQVGQLFNKANFGLAFPRGFPMLGQFNKEIVAMREDGFLDMLYKRWWYDLGSCELDTSALESSSLSALNFAGVFIIFGAFVVLALVMVVVENVTYYGRKTLRKKIFEETRHMRKRSHFIADELGLGVTELAMSPTTPPSPREEGREGEPERGEEGTDCHHDAHHHHHHHPTPLYHQQHQEQQPVHMNMGLDLQESEPRERTRIPEQHRETEKEEEEKV